MIIAFIALATAPGVLMLALLCAFLRGIDHDVFADEPDGSYEGLETGPVGYQRRPVAWSGEGGGTEVTFEPPASPAGFQPFPADAVLHISPGGAALLTDLPTAALAAALPHIDSGAPLTLPDSLTAP